VIDRRPKPEQREELTWRQKGNHGISLFTLVRLILVLSAVGLMSAAADISGPAHRPTPTSAESGSKDCSKVKDCEARCQCEYDQCATPCGVYDTECVKSCIKSWHTCKDACKS
jgi:hypothetical protein